MRARKTGNAVRTAAIYKWKHCTDRETTVAAAKVTWPTKVRVSTNRAFPGTPDRAKSNLLELKSTTRQSRSCREQIIFITRLVNSRACNKACVLGDVCRWKLIQGQDVSSQRVWTGDGFQDFRLIAISNDSAAAKFWNLARKGAWPLAPPVACTIGQD